MSNPYIGEIRMIAGNFAPVGWAFCDGQILPISEYEVVFALLGTTYGGDGEQTFALPDLRGRMPMSPGQNQGVGFQLGQAGGAEQVTLEGPDLPVHTHAIAASTSDGTTGSPSGAFPAHVPGGTTRYTSDQSSVAMAPGLVSVTGAGQPHENMSPYRGVNFIIALSGTYPTQ